MKLKAILEVESSVARAIDFAKFHHQGQFRKVSHKPYVTHPFKVYRRLWKFGVRDEDILIASVMHDLLEDSDVSYSDIVKQFGKRAADLVNWVTTKGNKATYIRKLMKQAPEGAIMIKVMDRIDNLQDNPNKERAKETTEIIRQGLENRNMPRLYAEFMKTYNKVYR